MDRDTTPTGGRWTSRTKVALRLVIATMMLSTCGACQVAGPAVVEMALPVAGSAAVHIGSSRPPHPAAQQQTEPPQATAFPREASSLAVASPKPQTASSASRTQRTVLWMEPAGAPLPTDVSAHPTASAARHPATADVVPSTAYVVALPEQAVASSDTFESHPPYESTLPYATDCPAPDGEMGNDGMDTGAPCLPELPPNAVYCSPPGGVGAMPWDEYLCDGGDQGVHVRVARDWTVSGLDLEDTVAHYDTLDGRTVVTPSNSVCIYAPRFAAVRKVVLASEDGLLVSSQAVELPLPPITQDTTDRTQLVDSPVPPLRDVGLAGPRGVHHRTRGIDLQHTLPVMELARDFEVHEDFQIIRLGIHRNSERALVEEYAEAAQVWTDNLAPEVMLDEEPAIVDVTVEKVGTEYHIGLEGKPRLRVIKLASTAAALPGEEVTFTLRFDNVGEQTIGNVTIMDNLTTRLEYIPDSAECSVKAEFFTDENQGESLALRWEIRDPIQPGEGGIIRFRCRVR